MSPKKPDFDLTRVRDDGASQAPEIVPISKPAWPPNTSRRSFLGLGLSATLALQELTRATRSRVAGSIRGRRDTSPGCGGLISQDGPVYALALAPDASRLVSGTWNTTLRLWGLPEGALLKKLTIVGTRNCALAVSPSGTTVASASDDGTIALWSLPDGGQIRTFKGTSGPGALAFSPDGRTLAVGGGVTPLATSRKVELWDVVSGKRAASLAASASSLAFSPDGKWLAAGELGRITLWGRKHGLRTRRWAGLTGTVGAVAFTPDSKMVVAADATNTIQLRQLSNGGKRVGSYVGHGGTVRALALSKDGKTLVSCSDDKTVKLWNLISGALVTTIVGHTDRVNAIAISGDGGMLASGSFDRTIRLWSLPSGTAIGCLIDLTVNPASTKGTTITLTRADGQVVTYTLPCGSPIPAGAVCTCNCIPGGPPCSCVGHQACACDTVCTCNTICTCQGVCSCVGVSHYWYPN